MDGVATSDKSETDIDYALCQYGRGRLQFRGPRREVATPYVAVLGGAETYGRYVRRPFPDLLEDATGVQVVNLGCVNAGLDAFLHDGDVLGLCARAEMTIVQVLGPQNMSNRFYSVHPRRNDRFIRASRRLQELFPEVDFTEITFTRHLLQVLQATSCQKFGDVVAELQAAWGARMRDLARRLPGPSLLLWLGAQAPPARCNPLSLGRGPLFVDRPMIDAVRGEFSDYCELVPGHAGAWCDLDGMVFPAAEAVAARELPGPPIHEQIADRLRPAVTAALAVGGEGRAS